MGGGAGEDVGSGRVGVGDRVAALVEVRLAAGRMVSVVGAAVGVAVGRARVAVADGSDGGRLPGRTVGAEGAAARGSDTVESGSGVGTNAGCGWRATTSALARRHRLSKLP